MSNALSAVFLDQMAKNLIGSLEMCWYVLILLF